MIDVGRDAMNAPPHSGPAPPPPFSAARAWLFAVGIGVPVVATVAVDVPRGALFAGAGALLAVLTDPRRQLALRAMAMSHWA